MRMQDITILCKGGKIVTNLNVFYFLHYLLRRIISKKVIRIIPMERYIIFNYGWEKGTNI